MIRKLAPAIFMAVNLLALSLAAQESKAPSDTKSAAKTLTGVVSDSMCGAQQMAKDKTAAECTRSCVKSGSDYALLVGEKVYVLKGNTTEIDKFAGERATVKGSLSGDTMNVESITPAKKSTKTEK